MRSNSCHHNRDKPLTIKIEDLSNSKKGCKGETFYSSSCKFALGISKYSSTTFTLGELGRFPIESKVILLNIFYWLRLEHGSMNPVLNEAFSTMKSENHQWLKDIQYLLCKIGSKNIWLDPYACSK